MTKLLSSIVISFWSKGWDRPVALQVLPIHLSTLKWWIDQASKYLQTPQKFESNSYLGLLLSKQINIKAWKWECREVPSPWGESLLAGSLKAGRCHLSLHGWQERCIVWKEQFDFQDGVCTSVTGQAASWGSHSRLSSELAMVGTSVRRAKAV